MTTTANNDAKHYVGYVAPALVQRTDLSPVTKLVAIALLMHRNRETGFCYATQETLSLELGLSESAVLRNIAKLKYLKLVKADRRKAPRGYAKGRGNLYDLSGLIDLCAEPILNAKEIAKRKPEVAPALPHASDFRATSGVLERSRSEVAPALPREVAPALPHASDFRAKEQKQRYVYITDALPSVDSDYENASVPVPEYDQETQENREVAPALPHSAQIAQRVASDGASQALSPEGRAFNPGTDDAWSSAIAAVKRAGGEDFNPGDLSKLIDEHGDEAVWFQAQWFLRRLASLKERVRKPTALFVHCVRDNSGVNPTWPAYCRTAHGQLTDDQQRATPRGDDLREWVKWLTRFRDLTIDDLPPHIRKQYDETVEIRREFWPLQMLLDATDTEPITEAA